MAMLRKYRLSDSTNAKDVVTTFRLFSGTTVDVEDRPKGGRMR